MVRFAELVRLFFLIFLVAPPVFAHVDGMTLRVNQGAGPGEVTLDWTGGQPVFSVYRSTSKLNILDPANLIGATSVRTFADAPPPGAIFFYEIASPCAYNPPEICNGVDDDCDGTVDGPEATAVCDDGLICNGAESCASGACQPGTPPTCEDGLACTTNACTEAQGCVVVACTTAPCWSTPVGAGIASGPSKSDRSIVPPGSPSATYVVKGATLYALRDAGDPAGPAGSIKWTWTTPTGQPVNNFPNPVPLSAGTGAFIFLGGADGFLYKVRASDGALTAQADLRRPSCPGDTIQATPAVQLYDFSNGTFQSEMDAHPGYLHDDAVFVITRNQCGDSTRNRVYALYASDLATKWVFNQNGAYKVDYGSDGCSVDYANNRLYCGTYQNPGQTSQNSLWAFDTTNAQVVWSGNAGSILNRPTLAGGRLYVATLGGSLMAYDPAGAPTGKPQPLWSSPAVTTAPITRTPWAEFRPGGTTIFIVDTAGTLYRFTDQGTQATKDWSSSPGPGLQYTTMPILAPGLEQLFVGRSDGKLQQLDATTGTSAVAIPLAPAGTVFDPGLDLPSGSGNGWLTVASGDNPGTVTGFCAPPPYGTCGSDADCGAWGGPCVVGTCDLGYHVCYGKPLADGTGCSDGQACSTGDACVAGVCKAADDSSCACVTAGDAACPPGTTCCGAGVCVNLLASSTHCGACGNACPADRVCSEGSCIAAPAACLSAPDLTRLNSVASTLAGADAITFDRGPEAAPFCAAYVSTYRYPTLSSLYKVYAQGGSITGTVNPGPNSAPLNGIATPNDGSLILATAVNRPGVPSSPYMISGEIALGFVVAATGAATASIVPFDNSIYNQGPVGPVLDHATYIPTGVFVELYFGNWLTNGDVVVIGRGCSTCPWTTSAVPVNLAGERITAIAFEVGKVPGVLSHRLLYLGHGTHLTIYDLNLGSPTSIDLNAGAPSPPIASILGIAVHPVYGAIYVEVKNTAGNRYLVEIDAHDYSQRHLRDVQVDLHLQPLVPLFFTNDGRITVMPQRDLLRLVLPPSGGTPVFEGWKVAR